MSMNFGKWFKRTYGYTKTVNTFESDRKNSEKVNEKDKKEDGEKMSKEDMTMSINERRARVKKFLRNKKVNFK